MFSSVLMLTTALDRVQTRGGFAYLCRYFQCVCVVPGHGGGLKAPRADCQLHQLYSKVSELPELQITADYRAGCSYTLSVSIYLCVCHVFDFQPHGDVDASQ